MRKLLLILGILVGSLYVHAQSIPPGSCGLLYSYDAAGNRIKQEYYCNNTASAVAMRTRPNTATDSIAGEENSFVTVDALYPNPTTGRFTIRFANELKDVPIQIADATGRVVQHINGSGKTMEFDISGQTSGTFFIIIGDGKEKITKKLIKL